MEQSDPSRRDVLKQTSAAAAALTAVGVGGTRSVKAASSSAISVRIQPVDYSVSSTSLENVYDALDRFFEQLNDVNWWSSIPYELYIVDDSTIRQDFLDEEVEYDACRMPNQNDIELNELEDGEDILVGVKAEGRWATAEHTRLWDVGDSDNDGDVPIAWVSSGATDDYRWDYPLANDDVKRYQNAAIQEVGHLLLEEDKAWQYSGYDGNDRNHADHTLGMITKDGESTPLITFYESDDVSMCEWDGAFEDPYDVDLTGEGNCSSDVEWDGSITKDITNCTAKAIWESCYDNGRVETDF